MSMTLAERLREARLRAGLSQSALGRAVGISPQAIQHLESGTSQRSRFLTAIAGAVGVMPAWLEGGVGPIEPPESFTVPITKTPPSGDGRENDEGVVAEIRNLAGRRSDRMKSVRYRPDELPAFPVTIVRFPSEEGKKYRKIYPEYFEEIYRLNEHIRSSYIGSFISRNMYGFVEGVEPEYLPRPHYLRGQVDAYALVVEDSFTGKRRYRTGDILHASPNKIYRRGDLGVLWLADGNFLLSEDRFSSDDEGISFDLTEGSGINDELPLWLDRKYRLLKLPWSVILGLDVVLGAEFAGWAATATGREREDAAYLRFLEREMQEEANRLEGSADNN